MLAKLQPEYKIERVNMIHLSNSSQVCEMYHNIILELDDRFQQTPPFIIAKI